MQKKLSTVIFLLIGAFLPYGIANAELTILYESYEQAGAIHYDDEGGGNGLLIGTFTTSQPLFFDNVSGVWIGASLKFESGNGPTARYQFAVSSSTNTLHNSYLWTTDEISRDYDTDYTFTEVSETDGGNTAWIVPGHTYGIYFVPTFTTPAQAYLRADALDLIYYGYLSWDGNYGSEFAQIAGITQIISVVPADDEVTSTSTTFSLSSYIFVNEDDYDEDLFVRFRYIRQQNLQTAVSNTNVLYETIDVPISGDGYSTATATTSILEEGEYLYTVEIRHPSLINNLLSWFNLSNIYDPGMIVRSSTNFIVGERTELDQFIFDMASTTNALITNPGVFEDIQDNCNPISGFDALGCLIALFIPNQMQLSTSVDTLQSYVLTKAPVGYVTRVISMLTEDATTTLPTIAYTPGSGPLEGQTLSFDFSGTMDSASAILTEDLMSDQDDPQNIWEVFMPLWNILVYAFLLIMIIKEVTGISHHTKQK